VVFLRLKEFAMSDIEKDFAVHEAVCAERYKGIIERLDSGSAWMKRIEMCLWVIAAAVLMGPGVAAEFVKKLLGM
jgi:glycerol-3-phosphate dehydrogenase